MRHPCERWGRQSDLQKLVFLSVREALYAPAHPDSKRQDRRKRRDLERYGARLLKQEHVVSCPANKFSKQREVKAMRARIEAENKNTAHHLARRLRGLTAWEHKPPAVPVDAIALMAQLHQMAQDATGASYAA